ncbi:ABC transporter ATP-binding protein [Microbispora sp. NEAU-D428]|uniref:ATP-binding cassette domain-containing protein n=1 Tax=Microbispora sitophila TaxID=2771537 RepID=UPI001867E490|nr:ABC transporter ATP-binding protein [Microbispora sitophila]MBE3012130.1 ABC transporter ATP-binding protein [Microbispora sitophila]
MTRPRPGTSGLPAAAAATLAGDRPVTSGTQLLLALLRPRRRPLAAAAAWSLVEAGPAWLSGLLVAAALDRGFLAGRPGTGMAWLAALGAAMLVKAVAARMMFPHLAALVEPMRDDLVEAVVTATVIRAARGGEPPDEAAANRLTQQVETLRELVSALLRTTRSLGVSLIAALGGLLVLSPPAAAGAAGAVLLALVVFARLLPVLVDRQRELMFTGERLTAEVTPILAGLRDVAACGARPQAYETVRAVVSAQAEAARALARAGLGRRLVVTLGAHVPLLALLFAAEPLTRHGTLSPGEIVGAVTYLSTGLDPALRSLTATIGGWGVTLAVTLRRIAETVTLPAVPAPCEGAASPDGHELRMERLTFAYAPQAEPVVRDLDLTVPEGEHLAVVGPSGIGKSTLSMLVTGLLRPERGEIRLGGVPLGEIAEPELRAMMALVPQEAYVFSGTVRENLAYLCPEETPDADLLASARAVGADALVERLGGLDAVIGEPSALSAGERQLITLARAHAGPARLVILDEATSHLDPAAEARAENAFAARQGTLIVIAHRISSARRARRVLLMDGATVVIGTHRDLVTRSPLYADLVGHWNGDDTTGGGDGR